MGSLLVEHDFWIVLETDRKLITQTKRSPARLLSPCKTSKRLSFTVEVTGDSSKVWTAIPSAIAFCFARAIGATQEAHFISYCRLLPPRETAKLFGTHE